MLKAFPSGKKREQNQNMAISSGDTYTIDVERLANSIELTMCEDLFMSPKRCIFKTPIALSRLNETSYIPDAFSIGPFHHGRPNLKATEKIKAKYLQSFISRSNFLLKDLINSINNLEKEAREYYDRPIGYSPEEFVKLLVIDGCFIIELFCKYKEYISKRSIDENDPIFSMSSMLQALDHDLILLENQVPWMILEHLYSKTMAAHITDGTTLIQLATKFFSNVFKFRQTTISLHVGDIKHIPDLFKKLLVSSIEEDKEKVSVSGISNLMPSATRLAEAGIKFKSSMSKNILDINFTNGVLEIPQLRIHQPTETFFRNLISFEQCYPNSNHMITSYVVLLDNLINTGKDVEILCENKILNNWLNPDDAAEFFNKLYHGTYVDKYFYENLSRRVNIYCQRRLPRWRVVLVRNYLNTPWAIFSTCAAVILLILSLQTLYTMKS